MLTKVYFYMIVSFVLISCGSDSSGGTDKVDEEKVVENNKDYWRITKIEEYDGASLEYTQNIIYDEDDFLTNKGSATYTYNVDGQLEGYVDGSSSCTYTHNPEGQLVQEVWVDDGYITVFVYTYEDGLIVKEDEYDTSVSPSNLVWTDYYRYTNGKLVKREGDTNDDLIFEVTDTYTYVDDVLDQRLHTWNSGSDLEKFFYDDNGNITKIERDLGNNSSVDETDYYTWEEGICQWGLEKAIAVFQAYGFDCI